MKPCPNKRRMLALHAAGALTQADRLNIERHVEFCAGCRQHFATLQRLATLYTAHGNQPVGLVDSVTFQRDLERNLQAEPSSQRPILGTGWFTLPRMAAIGLVALALTASWLWFNPRLQPTLRTAKIQTATGFEAQLGTSTMGAPVRTCSGPLPTWMYFAEFSNPEALEELLDQTWLDKSQSLPPLDLEVWEPFHF